MPSGLPGGGGGGMGGFGIDRYIKVTPAKGAYALSHKKWHKIYIKSKG